MLQIVERTQAFNERYFSFSRIIFLKKFLKRLQKGTML
jgi:hypothetical protein